jgi:hypothetical protein
MPDGDKHFSYNRTSTANSIIEQVVMNKSSILLKNILQNTHTLQLHTMIIKTEKITQKLLKMSSWKAWVQRPGGLIKKKRRAKRAQALKVRLQI